MQEFPQFPKSIESGPRELGRENSRGRSVERQYYNKRFLLASVFVKRMWH